MASTSSSTCADVGAICGNGKEALHLHWLHWNHFETKDVRVLDSC